MRAARHAAALACVLLGNAAASCELVLSEHRSGRVLQRVPLLEPGVRIAFEHSVLGTTVIDSYVFRPQAVLVEERFDGSGYGLPYAAAAGERLTQDAQGSRLELERLVHPLVVRPLPAQHMRLLLPSGPLLLGDLTPNAIELRALGCPLAGTPSSRRNAGPLASRSKSGSTREPGSSPAEAFCKAVAPGVHRDEAPHRAGTT